MRRLVPIALVATIAAGCGSTATTAQHRVRPGPRWATKAELAWVTRYGRWQRKLYDGIGYDTPGVLRCWDTLPVVGRPPTARLRVVLRTARAACTDALAGDDDRAVDLVLATLRPSIVGIAQRLPRTSGVSHTSPLFNRVASFIARRPVVVHCWAAADWRRLNLESARATAEPDDPDVDGMTIPTGAPTVEIAPDICSWLDGIALGSVPEGDRLDDAANAVDTLAHESNHARGVSNEARAECEAIQQVPEVAHMLRLPRSVGRAMARRLWADYSYEPKGYSTRECRAGSRLDLHLPSTVWP
jgi:hypothetical protein